MIARSHISRVSTARPRSRLILVTAVLAMTALAGGCANYQSPLRGILLITVSSLRSDALGCYGNTLAETPRMDRLARQGLLFRNAWSPAATSKPAFHSILSGNGFNLSAEKPQRLATESRLLPFKKQAWEIMMSISEPVLTYDQARAAGVDEFFTCLSQNVRFYRARMNNDLVRPWLEQRKGDRPLFCWVHYGDPAVPYDPPSPYFEFFCKDLANSFPDDLESSSLEAVFQKYLWMLYLAETSYMDRQVGRLLDTWEKLFSSRQSLVVVASLHGESFGENDIFFQSGSPHKETAIVPLIISGAHIAQGVVEDVVSLHELLPALQNLAKLPPGGQTEAPTGSLALSLGTNGSVRSDQGSGEALCAADGAWSFRHNDWHYVRYHSPVTYNGTDNYYTSLDYLKQVKEGTTSMVWLGKQDSGSSPSPSVQALIDSRLKQLLSEAGDTTKAVSTGKKE